ncbi:MAG: GDSL-type esterase/lipase family protein, partial [Pseudomonadota bacterium]
AHVGGEVPVPRLLIYGDSNTFGIGPMAFLGDDVVHPRGARWGDVAARLLGDGWEVVTEGLPGRTTVHDDPIEGAYRNGLTVLPAILQSHRPIDILVICLGTNDHKLRFGLRAEDVALGLARLAREAMASGVVGQVLLVAPPAVKERGDFAEMFAGAEARGAGLADHVARFARQEGAAFLDAGQVIAVDETDGIHWSLDAHAALGAALADTVRSLT